MRKTMAVGLALLMAGCFTTRTGGGAAAAGNERTDRQWFTAAGLIPLSESVGSECANGLAYSESTTSPLDVLLSAGVFLAGMMFAGIVCSQLPNSGSSSPCAALAIFAPPLLIGSRTVSYACSAGGGAGSQRPSPSGATVRGVPAQPGPPPPSDIVVPPPPPLPVP